MAAPAGSVYRHLPVNCPHCGAAGLVPIAKMHVGFTCEHCKRPFYLETSGAVKGQRKAGRAVAQVDYSTLHERPPGPVARLWLGLPRAGQWSTLGLMGVALFGVGVWFTLRLVTAPEQAPASLNQQAATLAEGIARLRSDMVRAVTMPSGRNLVVGWLQKVRPTAWSVAANDERVIFQYSELYKSSKTEQGVLRAQAAVQLTISPPRASASTAKQLELLTYWTRVGTGDWQFDAQRTTATAPGRK